MPQALLSNAFNLHDWMSQHLDGLDISRERRPFLAVLCYDVVIEHQLGIVTLLRSGINGSAFALIRPLFEAFVRGAWLRHCASEGQIDQFVSDKLDLEFWQLLKSVETVENFEDKVLSGLKKNAWHAMNSYTHGGIQQVCRRTSGAFIEPSFTAEEIAEVIRVAGVFALLAFQQIAIEGHQMHLATEALEMLAGFEGGPA